MNLQTEVFCIAEDLLKSRSMSFAPKLKMRGSRQGSSGLNVLNGLSGQQPRLNGSSPASNSKTPLEGPSSIGKQEEAKAPLTVFSTKKSRAQQAYAK